MDNQEKGTTPLRCTVCGCEIVYKTHYAASDFPILYGSGLHIDKTGEKKHICADCLVTVSNKANQALKHQMSLYIEAQAKEEPASGN